jgi:uncharacterized lipoprotein YmbA
MMILTGCTGKSQPSRFYLLRSLPESGAGMPKAAGRIGLSVLVGPITLPGYLDRSQLVTLTGQHELVLDEFTRWAEPLQDNFYRILVENLSLLLNTPEVYAYNSRGSRSTDFQIVIDITRFDAAAEGGAHLTAFWTVTGKDRDGDLVKKKSVLRAKLETRGTTGTVAAQNRTLTEFSREIAAVIQSLQR